MTGPVAIWRSAPERPVLNADEVHVWRASLGEAPGLASRLVPLVSSDERERAHRFRQAEHRDAFVAARGVLRSVLARYTSGTPEALRFGYGPLGKPRLPTVDGVEFNLSHAGRLVLIAVARRAVGVDVEGVGDLLDERERALVLAPEEVTRIDALHGASQARAFCTSWTYKEAYAKALGTGLSIPLTELSILPALDDGPTLRLPDASGSLTNGWHLEALDLGAGYRAALAVAGSAPAIRYFAWSG